MLRKAKYVGSTPYSEGTISMMKMLLNYLRNVSYSEKLIIFLRTHTNALRNFKLLQSIHLNNFLDSSF